MQSQTALTAYFKSNQLLPFALQGSNRHTDLTFLSEYDVEF